MSDARRFLAQPFLWLVVIIFAATNAGAQRVVVLSYNIHHGEGMDKEINLERIAKVIKSVAPDVVALQEVDRKTKRSNGVDQAEELSRLSGMKMVFGRTIDYPGGLYGNAVLSRLSIQNVTNHSLPFTEGREPRAVLAVEIVVPTSGSAPGGLFTLYATHFDFTPDSGDRLKAVEIIAGLIDKNPDRPAVLAGDLNAAPESPALKALAALWQSAGVGRTLPTVPVKNPKQQIDHILFHPLDRWKVVDVRVIAEPMASDHRPIVAALELLPPRAKKP
jgi:endonuclease/exonuclease/phosphatase family metal-dependent hydrolase